jgi:hypothetical protein
MPTDQALGNRENYQDMLLAERLKKKEEEDAPAEQLIAEKEGVVPPPAVPMSAGPEVAPQISTAIEPMDLYKEINKVAGSVKTKYPDREAMGADTDLAPDIDSLKESLKKLDAEKEGEQKEIAKRELYSNIASQIGKFAAAMYGMKNNVDMSGIAPEGPKFDNEYARLLDKYKNAKGDLTDTSTMSMKDKLRKQDRLDKETNSINAYNQDKAGFDANNNRTAASIQSQYLLDTGKQASAAEIAALKQTKDAGTKENKELAAAIKADAQLRKDIAGVLKTKGNNKNKNAQLRALLGNRVTPEQWQKMTVEPGLIWDSAKSPEDVVTSLTSILSSPVAAPAAAASVPMVTLVFKETGETKQVPADSIEAKNARTNPKFEVR